MLTKRFYFLCGIGVLVFLGLSCDSKPVVREYKEIVIAPIADSTPGDLEDSLPSWHPPIASLPEADVSGTSAMQDPRLQALVQDSATEIPLQWTTPEGWTEEKGSGLRLATFRSDANDPIECSIVTLGKMSGGLEANVQRWLGQIGLEEMSAAQLEQFLKAKDQVLSQTGRMARLFDFTTLQGVQPDTTPSMMTAILETEESTIFLKMTGSKAAVIQNRSKFVELCQSLNLKGSKDLRI